MIETRIDFKSGTGSKLVGTMHTPEKKTDKAIVVCPGFSGTADYEQGFAIFAADRGYAVFTFDFFAHGRSPGKSVDLTLTEELSDLRAAIKVVKRDYKDVGIVGHSLGGLIACMAADEAGALVLWAPAIQIKNVWLAIFKYEKKKLSISDPLKAMEEEGRVELPQRWGSDSSGAPFSVGKRMWNEMCDLDWTKVVEKINVPVKLIQAKKDGSPYVGFNKEAFSRIRSRKDFEMIDADHVFSGSRVKLYKSTVDWFDGFL